MVTDVSNTIAIGYSNNRFLPDEVVINRLRYYYQTVNFLGTKVKTRFRKREFCKSVSTSRNLQIHIS